MNVRKARLEDVDRILALLLQTPEVQGVGEEDPVYTPAYVADAVSDELMNVVFVAEEDSLVLGCLLAETWREKRYSFLVNFVVDPAERGKGTGKALYDAYESYCRQNDLHLVVALVQKDNVFMQGFCERRGYERGHELFLYEKKL